MSCSPKPTHLHKQVPLALVLPPSWPFPGAAVTLTCCSKTKCSPGCSLGTYSTGHHVLAGMLWALQGCPSIPKQ